MSLRSKPLWPAIFGGHPAHGRCAPLKRAPHHLLAVWLMGALVPTVALAQTPGDRDLIRERQERLLQEQQRRLDELRQLPGKVEQLPAQPATDDERCFAKIGRAHV